MDEVVRRAADKLSEQLHKDPCAKSEGVWYALEILDWVLEGKTAEEAATLFLMGEESPERWKNE